MSSDINSGEVVYDDAGSTPTANDADQPSSRTLPVLDGSAINTAATAADGLGCHAGANEMLPGDLETAKLFGQRVAATAAKFKG